MRLTKRPYKNRNLNIPLDEAEFELIDQAAFKAGLPMATWVRNNIIRILMKERPNAAS